MTLEQIDRECDRILAHVAKSSPALDGDGAQATEAQDHDTTCPRCGAQMLVLDGINSDGEPEGEFICINC